jgi:hypothetical protein
MAESVADAAFALAKEFAVLSLMVMHATVTTMLSILEMTTKGWLGSLSLVDSFRFLEFPRLSLTSDIFLLKYANEFLGCNL